MKRKYPFTEPSDEELIRAEIMKDHRNGALPETIASTYGYTLYSVNRILKKFQGKRNFARRKGAGRPTILNQGAKIAIVNQVRSKPWLTCSEIARNLRIDVSAETIRRYLKSLDYSYKKPSSKPKLKNEDKVQRTTWATNHQDFDFSRVVFMDETSFWLNNKVGKMWIKKGEEYYYETVAHPSKVHVIGYINADGILSVRTFRQNLKSDLLVFFLKEFFVKECNEDYGRGQWTLAFDNDPKHTAEETKEYLRRARVSSKFFFFSSSFKGHSDAMASP